MDKEKRMAGEFEIKQALHIGDKEIVYGVNLNGSSGIEYMVADYQWNELFSQYENIGVSNDYLEVITEYVSRIQNQIGKVKTERDAVTVPMDIITADQCYPNKYDESINGKVIAIKASVLRPEHRRADVQIVFVTGGNGSNANARGNAVYVNYLYSGKHTRFERYDVQGVLKPECYPDWAKDKLKLMEEIGNNPNVFEYSGYHFIPYRAFENTERGFEKISKRIRSDRDLGFSTYEWKKHNYSHEDFYKAYGKDGSMDLFKCLENGTIYVPGKNELYQYDEQVKQHTKKPKHKEMER